MAPRLAHRPVDIAKQDAILAAARAEFFGVGYAAASIERIAATAGVSKVTIYNHFQNKENLFSAVIGGECAKMRGEIQEMAETIDDLRTGLIAFAGSALNFLSSPDIIRFERALAAEVERHPEIASLFLDAGPRQMQTLMAHIFATAMERGLFEKADPKVAAAHFYGMVTGFNMIEWRFSIPDAAPSAMDENSIAATVDRFLHSYRPQGSAENLAPPR